MSIHGRLRAGRGRWMGVREGCRRGFGIRLGHVFPKSLLPTVLSPAVISSSRSLHFFTLAFLLLRPDRLF